VTTTVTAGTVTSVDGTTIAFERSGQGPALVLVDGACCHRAFGPLRPLAALLSADFTVHTYDRRGRGASGDAAPYDPVCEVEDLAAIIEVAGGSASLYGVSSGALLALQAAADCGITIPRLALFEPPVGDGAGADDDTAAVIDELLAEGRRGDAVERFQTAIGIPAEVVAGMQQEPFWPGLEAVAHTLPYDLTIPAETSLDLAAEGHGPHAGHRQRGQLR
jgi:pimeloyl-ACP methyl ester carboxylesterase